MCTDMLMTEKYVSGTYNTAVFEFQDTRVRDVLNHIQKEEQKHGEAIFQYMHSKGMYQPQ
jgi:spore coat protein CotF